MQAKSVGCAYVRGSAAQCCIVWQHHALTCVFVRIWARQAMLDVAKGGGGRPAAERHRRQGCPCATQSSTAPSASRRCSGSATRRTSHTTTRERASSASSNPSTAASPAAPGAALSSTRTSGSKQLEMITSAAMRTGFRRRGVDYPHSTRAKKFFLCLMVGPASVAQALPKAKGWAQDGGG